MLANFALARVLTNKKPSSQIDISEGAYKILKDDDNADTAFERRLASRHPKYISWFHRPCKLIKPSPWAISLTQQCSLRSNLSRRASRKVSSKVSWLQQSIFCPLPSEPTYMICASTATIQGWEEKRPAGRSATWSA